MTAAARSLLSSRPFHIWCPTPGMYWVRSMVGTAAIPERAPSVRTMRMRRGREHRHIYTALFGGVQSFEPSGDVGAADPVRPLIEAIDRALSASVLSGDATSIALSLWVTLHGLVTLELAGALDTATAETTFRSTIPAALRGSAA